MSACRKYVQLLLGFGFGGVEVCPIHEQSGECVRSIEYVFFQVVQSKTAGGKRLGYLDSRSGV